MRISAAEKIATRKRIIGAAKTLFRSKGFDQATTRDIAKEVGIATGTMFNYFASKEAIVIELVADALEKAQREFQATRREKAGLSESLFAIVAAQLRHLRPLRKYIQPFADVMLSPSVSNDPNVNALRSGLNEQFEQLLHQHGIPEVSSTQLNIFWSLYVGVLRFWSTDKSPKQEDSLAMLDQAIGMYVLWLDP